MSEFLRDDATLSAPVQLEAEHPPIEAHTPAATDTEPPPPDPAVPTDAPQKQLVVLLLKLVIEQFIPLKNLAILLLFKHSQMLTSLWSAAEAAEVVIMAVVEQVERLSLEPTIRFLPHLILLLLVLVVVDKNLIIMQVER